DRRRLLDWMCGYYALPPGELVPLFHPPSPGTRARASRVEPVAFPLQDSGDIRLTCDQSRAVDAAVDHLDRGDFGVLLLHGVTGSGKTEVYLRAIAESLDRGRSAIYLLPEIALTPQTDARIRERFGDTVATLHSALSAGQRCRVHEAAAAGEVKVVVGPRSALFAPVRDLGLVVMDEEHETSYKQEEKPRYHARHAAVVRAREAGAFVILGSATPDLESVRNARDGRYRLVELKDRPVGEIPSVEIIDMRGEQAADGFSPALLQGLEDTLARDRQAILYYNRRGYARVLQCASCGVAVPCPRCDIGLTMHLRPRRLLCHYCGHARPAPDDCPDCGGTEFLPPGGGTAKLELAPSAHFPDARSLRPHQDPTRPTGSHPPPPAAFAGGEADILVGTQMVAKGHHFPGVDLVGVLAADDGVSLPDYRAHERSFQLLTQVAGRTGRGGAGAVIFQTWQPDHAVLRHAAAQDTVAFADEELAVRELVGYPPYRRMLRLALTSRRLGEVTDAAATLADLIRAGLRNPELEVLGPAPAVFVRLHDRYRFQLLLKGLLSNAEKDWLADCARRLGARTRGLDVMLDVDPVGMW
nr:primosomal protein N' [bacterium]